MDSQPTSLHSGGALGSEVWLLEICYLHPLPSSVSCSKDNKLYRSLEVCVSFPVLYGYGGGDEVDRPELLAFLLVGLRAILVLV